MLRRGCQSGSHSVPRRSEGCQSLPWRTQCLEALPRDVGLLAGDAAERGGLIARGERGKTPVVVLRGETDGAGLRRRSSARARIPDPECVRLQTIEAGLPAMSPMLGLTRLLGRGVPDAMPTGRCQRLNDPRRPSSAFARSVVRSASTQAGPDACDDATPVSSTRLPMIDIKKEASAIQGFPHSGQWRSSAE